jgi:septal ring factor EnvC (AmiA/AmiB activator)
MAFQIFSLCFSVFALFLCLFCAVDREVRRKKIKKIDRRIAELNEEIRIRRQYLQ